MWLVLFENNTSICFWQREKYYGISEEKSRCSLSLGFLKIEPLITENSSVLNEMFVCQR